MVKVGKYDKYGKYKYVNVIVRTRQTRRGIIGTVDNSSIYLITIGNGVLEIGPLGGDYSIT